MRGGEQHWGVEPGPAGRQRWAVLAWCMLRSAISQSRFQSLKHRVCEVGRVLVKSSMPASPTISPSTENRKYWLWGAPPHRAKSCSVLFVRMILCNGEKIWVKFKKSLWAHHRGSQQCQAWRTASGSQSKGSCLRGDTRNGVKWSVGLSSVPQ